MASAASGFVVTPNVATNTSSSVSSRTNLIFFPKNSTNRTNLRFVVRASEEAAAPPAATTAPPEGGEAPKPTATKPPPVGPKRGTKVSHT